MSEHLKPEVVVVNSGDTWYEGTPVKYDEEGQYLKIYVTRTNSTSLKLPQGEGMLVNMSTVGCTVIAPYVWKVSIPNFKTGESEIPLLDREQVNERIRKAAQDGKKAYEDRGGFSETTAFYLSFVKTIDDEDTWIGGCYIRADTIDEASFLGHHLKLNPGGEVQITGPFEAEALIPEFEHKLLTTREELDAGIDTSKLQVIH